MAPNFDPQELSGKIFSEIKDLASNIGKAQGLKGYGLLVPVVLARVEEIRNDTHPLTGEQKKEVASRVLNLLINLPVLPEFIEAKIFSMAIDWFVAFFNRAFGQNWLQSVKAVFGG